MKHKENGYQAPGIQRHLIQHDFMIGLLRNWLKYLFGVFIFLVPCVMLNNMTDYYELQPSFMDYLINIFKGMEIYVPDPSNPFIVPINFLIFNVYLAFIVGSYPLKDLYSTAQNVLIRSKTRWRWWLSKCIWNTVSVIVYYLLLYVTVFVFAGLTGKLSMAPTEVSWNYLSINVVGATVEELIVAVAIIPIVTSVAISIFQMALSFIANPTISYLFVVVVFVASAYYFNPALIGNYPMLLRSELVMEGGIEQPLVIGVCLAIVVVSIVGGYFYFRKMDILDKSSLKN